MFTKTQKSTQVTISDSKAFALCDIMENFRMLDLDAGYKEWFIRTVRDSASYVSSSYEYCSRMDGIRINIHQSLVTGKVNGATLSRDSEQSSFSQEMVDFGNQLIKEVFV